jgi:hypothetical protein
VETNCWSSLYFKYKTVLQEKAVEATKQKEEKRKKTQARAGTGRHAVESLLVFEYCSCPPSAPSALPGTGADFSFIATGSVFCIRSDDLVCQRTV